MKSKIMLRIQYNGENFCGWQSQKDKRTVQTVLEMRISELLKEEIKLTSSSRTDSGVHAIMQVAHFETFSNFDIKKLSFAINAKLADDVRVLSAKKVGSKFHSRFSTKQKTYLYKIYCSKIAKPLKKGLAVQIPTKLNLSKMKEASSLLLGTHDFSAFCATNSSVKSHLRTIYNLTITKIQDEIHFKITGNGFLYNMVRIIIGTLIEIGKEKLQPQDILKIIASKNRKNASITMPAYGLYLYRINF